jgi:hypothetical protein
MKYSLRGDPTILSDGRWTTWLTTRIDQEISEHWTRAFLVQEFTHLPWYTKNKTIRTSRRPDDRHPRDRDEDQPPDTPPRPLKKHKKEKQPTRLVSTVTPAKATKQPNPQDSTPTGTKKKIVCFRTVAIGHGITTYKNDNKPTLPPRPLLSCADARAQGNTKCPGDHHTWKSWTKTATRANLVHAHDANLAIFLSDSAHASFYTELLDAVDNSTILA